VCKRTCRVNMSLLAKLRRHTSQKYALDWEEELVSTLCALCREAMCFASRSWRENFCPHTGQLYVELGGEADASTTPLLLVVVELVVVVVWVGDVGGGGETASSLLDLVAVEEEEEEEGGSKREGKGGKGNCCGGVLGFFETSSAIGG